MRWETKGHFVVGTVILGFLSIFKNSQASTLFDIELHVPLEVSTG